MLALVEKNGTLLIATGGPTEGQIYQVNPAAEETIVLAKVNPKQVLSLLPTSDGRIYMGLANVGGIATLSPGFAAQGKYTSPVLDAQQVSRFGNLQLHGALPQGTGLKVATRSGNVRDSAQKSWSDWSEEMPASEFVKIVSPPARFLQYRLTFTSAEGGKVSPVVEDVSVAYQMPNLPPQIKSVKITPTPDAAAPNPLGGGDVEPVRIPTTRKQMIAWEAVDANGDALVYSPYFRRGASAIFAFWAAYILTRPLGAALGDLLSQSKTYGGLGLGAMATSVIFLTIIVALVAQAQRRRFSCID